MICILSMMKYCISIAMQPFSTVIYRKVPYGVCSFKLWFCPCRFRDKIDVQQEAIALIACLATDVELVLHQSAIEGIHGMILNAMNSFPDQISLCEISLEALGECFLSVGTALY